MRKIIFTCDICGDEKKPSNGWIVAVSVDAGGIRFLRFEDASEGSISQYTHLCGEGCATKLLCQFFSAPPTRKIKSTNKYLIKSFVSEEEDDVPEVNF